MLVRNISTGPRGAYLGTVLVEANPGEVVEADDFAPEWFEPAEPVGEPEVEALAKLTVLELRALAGVENIDLGDATVKKDIVSAIELAREANAD